MDLKIFLMSLAVVCLAGCIMEEDGDVLSPVKGGIPIEFSIAADTTKATLNIADGQTVEWEEGDVVGIFQRYKKDGSTIDPEGVQNIPYRYDASSGKFVPVAEPAYWAGDGTETQHQLYVCYPYDEACTTCNSVRASVSDVQEYDATAIRNNIASEGFAWERNWELEFGEPVFFKPLRQYFSVLRFNITNGTEKDFTISEVKIEAAGEIAITQNVTLNALNDGHPKVKEKVSGSKVISVVVKNGFVQTGKSIDVRAMVYAGSLSGKQVTVTVTSTRGVHPSLTFTAGNIDKGGRAVKHLTLEDVDIPEDCAAEIPIDFSYAGYGYGVREIPDVPVKITLNAPSDGSDATSMIQEALDRVETPGAVLLKSGQYNIGTSLKIGRSGVVLRGEGESTVLKATGTVQRAFVSIGNGMGRTVGAGSDIVENVPVGQMWVKVEDVSSFTVGERVAIHFKPNDKWVTDLKMDQITGTATQWSASEYQMYWEREIRTIEGDRIWLDCPVVMELDAVYAESMSLRKISRNRIEECGIENLYMESEYDASVVDEEGNHVDENHAWYAMYVMNAEDSWIRNVKTACFGMSSVIMQQGARCVTVENCQSTRPVSLITGSRRYAFYIHSGELCLVKNCTAEFDRHGFVTAKVTPGPNVFLDCVMKNGYNGVGPHQRWANGVLYDCCDGDIRLEVEDRGDWGSGHGWAGVNFVFWNCEADRIVCQNPWIGGQNWCVGAVGSKDPGRLGLNRPDGVWIAYGMHVSPTSLYRHQLDARNNTISQNN